MAIESKIFPVLMRILLHSIIYVSLALDSIDLQMCRMSGGGGASQMTIHQIKSISIQTFASQETYIYISSLLITGNNYSSTNRIN